MNLTALYLALTLSIGSSFNPVTRAEYYPVFGSTSAEDMENMIEVLEKSNKQNAYLGAMKMKLSGFKEGMNEKLQTFKEGRTLLEEEIALDKKNVEWRFLRLVIQENTPKILKYKANLQDDVDFIETNYNSVESSLKKVIQNYAEKSEILNSTQLK